MIYSHSVSRARNEQEERRAIERIRRERAQRELDAALRKNLLDRDPGLSGVLSRTIITVVR